MKIRLHFEEEHGEWEEWEDTGENLSAPLIELPDAIVKEWRALIVRQGELSDYFDEVAMPLIRAERQRQSDEWEKAKPVALMEQQRVPWSMRHTGWLNPSHKKDDDGRGIGKLDFNPRLGTREEQAAWVAAFFKAFDKELKGMALRRELAQTEDIHDGTDTD